MNENLITTIIIAIVGPILTLVANQWYQRRRNKIEYGDDLLDAMNKAAQGLRDARAEIAALDGQLRTLDQNHEKEIEDLQHQHKRERERLRERISKLEKVLVRYDVSFTLVTHPEVRVENMRVIGTEDVLATGKLQAMTPERIREEQERGRQK